MILKVCSVTLFCPTPQPHGLYVVCQAPLSMVFPSQEYWKGPPFPTVIKSNTALKNVIIWFLNNRSEFLYDVAFYIWYNNLLYQLY